MKGNLMKSKKITGAQKAMKLNDDDYFKIASMSDDEFTDDEKQDAISSMLNDYLQSDDDFRLELEKQRLVDRMILND